MGWIDSIQGKIIALDTMPFIYFIEANPTYLAVVREFFQALDRGEFTAVTSTVTLLEVLVHPIAKGDIALAKRYRSILLNSKGLVTIPISTDIAEEGARLRATHNIRTPDAIQMATALHMGASYFLTNDTKYPSLSQIQTLVLDALRAQP